MPEAVLYVNGRRVRTQAAVGTRLLDLLRDELDLTAAKPGCRTGDCGACAVLVSVRWADSPEVVHELHNSCLTTLEMVAGCHVITAEGLVPAAGWGQERLGPVHRSLIDAGAVQCGYCTPGFVVALTWALLTGAEPCGAVGGNLCRCTGYMAIRRACDLLMLAGPIQPGDLLPAAIRQADHELDPVPAAELPPPAAAAAARFLGGGTDEIPDQGHAAPANRRATLLRRVPQMCRITERAGGVEVGAAVTVGQLQASSAITGRWPELADHLAAFGSPAVRSAATVGGNLVHASPAADLAVPLLALGATVSLTGGDAGRREVPLERLFLAYKRIDCAPGEVLESVWLPDPRPGTRLHIERVARRRIDDTASASLAAVLGADQSGFLTRVRIAAGGVAPVPILLAATAEELLGTRVDATVMWRALAAMDAEIAPIDDLRGSAEYKRALLGHLLVSAVGGDDAAGLVARMGWGPDGQQEPCR